MKKSFLKIFIFFMIIFLTPKVFAQEFNMNSYTSATKNGTTNRYRATEIYNTGTSNTYTFGTRYNGRISDIETYFNYPFVANTTYTLTYNMSTDDFRNNLGSSYFWDCDQTMTNNNATVISPTYVSMRKVKFTFRTSSSTSCIRVWLRSTNISSTAITGVSNWQLNNITIYDPDFQDGSSSGNQGSSSGNTSTDNTNSDIINNNNQNTQEIIENNNQNTQDIINNQNSIFKDCQQDNLINVRSFVRYSNSINLSVADEHGVNWTGQGVSGILFYQVLNVVPDNMYHLTYTRTNVADDFKVYIYAGSASFSGSNIITNGTSTDLAFNTGSNNKVTVAFYSPSALGGVTYKIRDIYLTPTEPICTNKLDDQTNAINNVNDSINNDNIDSGVGTDFFSDFQDNSHGLTSIITAPLTAISSITSSTCQPLTIPIPFTNGSVSLPCMTQIYQDNIPTIYNIWKIVSFGIIAYFICLDIFHIVKGFKDPESDKVEVLDL